HTVLVFLLLGILAGEDGPGRIEFDDFGLSYLIGTVALAIILLNGGLRTRTESFRVGLKPALVLATAGVLLTTAVTGLAASWLLIGPEPVIRVDTTIPGHPCKILVYELTDTSELASIAPVQLKPPDTARLTAVV